MCACTGMVSLNVVHGGKGAISACLSGRHHSLSDRRGGPALAHTARSEQASAERPITATTNYSLKPTDIMTSVRNIWTRCRDGLSVGRCCPFFDKDWKQTYWRQKRNFTWSVAEDSPQDARKVEAERLNQKKHRHPLVVPTTRMCYALSYMYGAVAVRNRPKRVPALEMDLYVIFQSPNE